MPEHYEVKRIADYLKDYGLLGQRLIKSEFKNKGERILKNDLLFTKFDGARLHDIKVKAKYTGFEFDWGTALLHYRFTGIPHLRGIPYGNRLQTIFSLPIKYSNPDHCRFTWQFDTLFLDYYDTRCLSTMTIFEGMSFDQIPVIQQLPVDIGMFTAPSFTVFKQKTTSRKKQLKLWLLDQTIAPSGIGNYLACEILAHAKLNPFMPINSLTLNQFNRLMNAIHDVSKCAGRYADYDWFKVFNRDTCGFCGEGIQKKRLPVGAQTTHFCAKCQ